MEKALRVKIVGKYGNALAYPTNDVAELFCKIAGTKTLTKKNLEIIKKLGFEIVFEGPTLEDLEK